jgi:methylated-DNA-[protein]-cysteine S-methyltransferase
MMATVACDIVRAGAAGWAAAVSRGRTLVAVEMGPRKDRLAAAVRGKFGEVEFKRTAAGRQLTEYFAGKRRAFSIDLDLSGLSPFFRRILKACAAIPFGRTATYGELARAAGSPMAARAAGAALAANPLPIVIPCHRVIAASGKLTGYSAPGGLAVKHALLRHEGAGPASEVRRPQRRSRQET